MKYESGMQIIYDVLKKGVFVEFRGRSHYLDGPFSSQREAVRAAEDHCRRLGWQSDSKPS
jgi:hypothetical protein